MKRTISVFMAIALTAVVALSGNVLASDDQATTPDAVVEQGQGMVEEGKEMAEESAMQAEDVQMEGEQAVETMQENAQEMAPPPPQAGR